MANQNKGATKNTTSSNKQNNPNSITITAVMREFMNEVKKEINGSGMPEKVKSAIKSGIKATIYSTNRGMVEVSAERSSLLEQARPNTVNLARTYHYGWRVGNSKAYYKGMYKNQFIHVYFAKTKGFSGHPGHPFLENAAAKIMSRYSDVSIVIN